MVEGTVDHWGYGNLGQGTVAYLRTIQMYTTTAPNPTKSARMQAIMSA